MEGFFGSSMYPFVNGVVLNECQLHRTNRWGNLRDFNCSSCGTKEYALECTTSGIAFMCRVDNTQFLVKTNTNNPVKIRSYVNFEEISFNIFPQNLSMHVIRIIIVANPYR